MGSGKLGGKYSSQTTNFTSDNLTPEIYAVIGQKVHDGDISTIEKAHEILDRVNPNYYDDSEDFKKYHWNCQRCAPALELQMRGYDVEAMPWNGSGIQSYQTVFNYDSFDYDNNVVQSSNITYVGQDYVGTKNNPNKFGRGAKAATKTIVDSMNKWGPNSRAMMIVSWKNTSSSHIVNVARVNGEICILDGQDGSISARGSKQIQTYMENTTASKTALLRVDHLSIKTKMGGDSMDNSRSMSHVVKKIEKKK